MAYDDFAGDEIRSDEDHLEPRRFDEWPQPWSKFRMSRIGAAEGALARFVVDDRRRRSHERERSRPKSTGGPGVAQHSRVFGVVERLHPRLELPLEGDNLFRGRWAGDESLDRHGPLAVPVLVETPGDAAYHGSRCQEIEIRKIDVGMRLEILVADIPPADDRCGVVGDPRLVVHAAVESHRVRNVLEQAHDRERSAAEKGVVGTHLEVGLSGKNRQVCLVPGNVEIVDEESHAHAPLRRREQAAEQELARRVVMNRVVLQIQGALRRLGERRAERKRFHAGIDQIEPGAGPGSRRRIG